MNVSDMRTNSNNGSISIAANQNLLFLTFNTFDSLQLFPFCSYNQYLDPDSKQKCYSCPEDFYSLDTDSSRCYSCNEEIGDYLKQMKLNYICNKEVELPFRIRNRK